MAKQERFMVPEAQSAAMTHVGGGFWRAVGRMRAGPWASTPRWRSRRLS